MKEENRKIAAHAAGLIRQVWTRIMAARKRSPEDAPKYVCITRTDIRNGIRGHTSDCPVALALSREIRCPVLVGYQRDLFGAMYKAPGKDHFFQSLPGEVREWMSAYDMGDSVDPINFEWRPKRSWSMRGHGERQ